MSTRKNLTEMLQILGPLGCIGVKAEYEDEGSRLSETYALRCMSAEAGLTMTIKLGGAAAVHDMRHCQSIGADAVVAPMIETPYAAEKFLELACKVWAHRLDEVSFWMNIETVTACANIEAILNAALDVPLAGLVVGRADLGASLGLRRDQLDSPPVMERVDCILRAAKDRGLATALGGGISSNSFNLIRRIPGELLDRIETRKVIFSYKEVDHSTLTEGILLAGKFEIAWLQAKRADYQLMAVEDDDRIGFLSDRQLCSSGPTEYG
jgi:4-hydroxy-2-oxoheptanedioate aldolase